MNLPLSLEAANREFSRTHPGESGTRQPVHVVYGGAHLFKRDLVPRLGALALRSLEDYAPDAATLALAVGIPNALAETVHSRVLEKLRREPVEDFRIDFEDGYGVRPDAEEDDAAVHAAEEVAHAMAAATLPAFFGIRIKPLDEEQKSRSVRTLELFLKTLLARTGGRLPQNFVVTLPKITVTEQVTALLAALDRFASIPIELMIETPQSLFLLPHLIEASRGRLHRRPLRRVRLHREPGHHRFEPAHAASGVRFCAIDDAGPVRRHRRSPFRRRHQPDADPSSSRHAPQRRADRGKSRGRPSRVDACITSTSAIRSITAFIKVGTCIRRSLSSRYAAVYSFFLEGLERRLGAPAELHRQSRAGDQVGGVFDDAATGQGLLNYFLRAINCGAIAEADAPALTGLSLEELRSASFAENSEHSKEGWHETPRFIYCNRLRGARAGVPVRKRLGRRKNDRQRRHCGRSRPDQERRPIDRRSGVDMTRYTAIPGMIDVHTHMTYVLEHESLAQAGRGAATVYLSQDNAKKTLETGVTTVRNLGASDYRRHRHARSHQHWPDGRSAHVRLRLRPANHARRTRRTRQTADGPAEVMKVVRQQMDAGADVIKMYGSTGSGQDVTGDQTFTYEEMKAAVDAAHAPGKKIAIHTYGPRGARDAARAGADSIEHATDMDDETIAEMARKKIFYVPTIDHNRYYVDNAQLLHYPAARDRPA